MSYTLEYVDNVDTNDEVFEFDNIKIFVDPKSSLFLIGTQMDYIEGELESGFKFVNPNEKGRCGCRILSRLVIIMTSSKNCWSCEKK